MKPSRGSCAAVVLLACLATMGAPAPLAAQSDDDFLFRTPRLRLGISLGFLVPRAGGDVFEHIRRELFVEQEDFNTLTAQAEVAVRVTERLDVALGAAWASRTKHSESRLYNGSDGLPILQSTRFAQAPLTAGVKVYLRDRGRSVGQFAWVPLGWTPYVGGGVGLSWYALEQEGEFVDHETLEIFRDYIASSGWGETAHVRAGFEVPLNPRLVFSTDGRYTWGSAPLAPLQFRGFDDIDLAGFQASVGLSLRF